MYIMIPSPQALRDLEDAWLATSPRTPNTMRAYRNELDRLGRFLSSCGRDVADLNATLLERFWSELTRGTWHETRQRPTASSIDQSRRIISAFVSWLVRQELAPVSALASLATWRSPVGRPQKAVADVAQDCLAPLPPLLRVSDLDGLAAAFCFWAGASPGELAGIAVADVDGQRAELSLTQRGVRRTVAIPRRLVRSLQSLLVPGQTWLFRVGAEPPSPAAMAQRVSRWLGNHGGGDVGSARALREQFQRHARAKGWNSDEIRSQMRRTSLPLPPLSPPSHQRLASLISAPK